MFDYDACFQARLNQLKDNGNYRIFAEIKREAGNFPTAKLRRKEDGTLHDVTVWCSNDYLGMGQNPQVVAEMQRILSEQGAGAGGTRNISGTNVLHADLEKRLAEFHQKPAALLFNSGYVANLTSLQALGRGIEGMTIYSDSLNHNSMIEGIKQGKARKHVFRHNDPDHLAWMLKSESPSTPKVIAFESVYSMDGDLGLLAEFIELAKTHGALTYLDEVHAVGMYGPTGAGIAEAQGLSDEIDLIQGTLAKAIGVIGGYIAGSTRLCDFVRSYGNAFIFSTALPPYVAAGALKSIDILSGSEGKELRTRHQQAAQNLKDSLLARNLPVMNSQCHIVPLLIGEAVKCRTASDLLLDEFSIYVQPINYPTVPVKTERLRLTPSPNHDAAKIDALVEALDQIWERLNLPRMDSIDPALLSAPMPPAPDRLISTGRFNKRAANG